MTSFSTNQKGRKLFAAELGLTINCANNLETDEREYFKIGFSTNGERKWEFVSDGFQWTIEKLRSLGIKSIEFDQSGCLLHIGIKIIRGSGRSLGEQLFNAVVALQKERRNGGIA